jgi:hypothetical protein
VLTVKTITKAHEYPSERCFASNGKQDGANYGYQNCDSEDPPLTPKIHH